MHSLMAPVCCSSSRPLGVAAKLSRLSNNVSSQMSLWPQSESEKKKNNNNDNNMLQCSESSEQWFFTGSQMEVRWPTGYLKVCILKDRIDLFFLKKIQRNYRRFLKNVLLCFASSLGTSFEMQLLRLLLLLVLNLCQVGVRSIVQYKL